MNTPTPRLLDIRELTCIYAIVKRPGSVERAPRLVGLMADKNLCSPVLMRLVSRSRRFTLGLGAFLFWDKYVATDKIRRAGRWVRVALLHSWAVGW